MKITKLLAVTMAFMAAAAVGCEAEADISAPEKPTSAHQETTDAAETTEKKDEPTEPTEKYQLHFKNGAWSGESGFYLFNGETSGRTLSYDRKEGVAFEYEAWSDGSAVFHMGAAENNTEATIETNGEYECKITWQDGRTEVLLHVDECDYDNFNFATNDEVREIALKYFERQNGHRPAGADIDGSNCRNKVSLELFDIVDDERVTVACYRIDRISLMGIDAGFDEINFNEPNAE